MAKKEKEIIIIEVKKEKSKVRIVGTSPLRIHKFSEKSRKQLRDKHLKKAKQARGVREPEKEYAESLYWLGKNGQEISANGDPSKHKYGFGFPANGVKKCMVNAAVDVEGLPKTAIRRAVFILPQSGCIKINGTPKMREDFVRVGGKGPGTGAADLRYRGEFWPWSVDLEFIYNAKAISIEQIINLLNLSGFSTGIGEERPEKGGDCGMFEVSGVN